MKTFSWVIRVLAVVLIWGCSDEDLVKYHSDVRIVGNLPATRMSYTDNGSVVRVSWDANDRIGVCCDGEQRLLTYTAQNSGSSTEFAAVRDRIDAYEGATVCAMYPAAQECRVSCCNWEQKYGAPFQNVDFIYASAVVENGTADLHFKHLYAFLEIKIPLDHLVNEDRRGLIVRSSESVSILNYPLFDLKKGQFVENEDEEMQTFSDVIYYEIPSDEELGEEVREVTCCIAILPQTANAQLSIYQMAGGDEVDCLLTKQAPADGFKAGNVYTLFLDANESEAKRIVERNVLETFYKQTDGDNWKNNTNWCSDKPVGEWYGITTNAGGLITSIKLNSNSLKGHIPSELGQLTCLESLELGSNELSGIIPSELGNCPLTSLGLAGNQLSGEFPDIPSLYSSKGKRLELSRNRLIGPLPKIGENMTLFYVNDNLFTGPIPPSHLTALNSRSDLGEAMKYGCKYLVLRNNLSGTLPDEIALHENFHVHWFNILPQNTGYGFDKVNIPAHGNTVKCYDGTFINLAEEYAKNKYTILVRWGPGNTPTNPPMLELLRRKYQDKGLGMFGMTQPKYTNESLEPLTSTMPGLKIFWESAHGDEYNNNPYSFGWLFYFNPISYVFVIDQNGHILFFGSGGVKEGTVPQYHEDEDDIYDFVANLFGDEKFVPDWYTSTDYSRDGEVVTLQKATQGKGIDLVFMGEAFVDKDMASGGKYEQKMREGMEQFFSVEPYRSFRNRFNIYAVKVVSPNAEFYPGAEHRINGSAAVCFEYVQKVPGRNPSQEPMVAVIYNSGNAGRSYTIMISDGSFVSYIQEDEANVLIHEVGGHGFAKLRDEYVEGGNEELTLPQEERSLMDEYWEQYQWGANVDWRNDAATVKWAHFLRDSRYEGEGLGLYEGAYLYGHGCYRPTENSMMRHHYVDNVSFNAPSREQIYKTIMRLSEGSSWMYNYEEFVRYDAINRGAATTRALHQSASAEQIKEWRKNHRPPVYIQGTWREAWKQGRRNVTPLR